MRFVSIIVLMTACVTWPPALDADTVYSEQARSFSQDFYDAFERSDESRLLYLYRVLATDRDLEEQIKEYRPGVYSALQYKALGWQVEDMRGRFDFTPIRDERDASSASQSRTSSTFSNSDAAIKNSNDRRRPNHLSRPTPNHRVQRTNTDTAQDSPNQSRIDNRRRIQRRR